MTVCRVTLLFAFVVLGACSNGDDGRGGEGGLLDGGRLDDGGAAVCSAELEQSHINAAKRSADGQGWCCKPGLKTCDCGYFGGFVYDRCDCGDRSPTAGTKSPYGYCDLAPPDWILETDVHGCSAYHARTPTTACCNCLLPAPDGGR